MKKSEITAALEAELQARLDGGFNVKATAREIVAAFEEAVEWELEEPELPKGLALGPMSLGGEAGREGYLLHVVIGKSGNPGIAEAVVRAMIAAYNREREEERIEAEMDDAKLDEGLERICREESKAILDERTRCLSILDWLLASLPQGWDYARRMTEGARRKVESGKRVEADDVPTAAGAAGAGMVQPFPSPAWSVAHVEEPDQFTPEPVPLAGDADPKVFPPSLAEDPVSFAIGVPLREAVTCHDEVPCRGLTWEEREEARRRREEEPRLRQERQERDEAQGRINRVFEYLSERMRNDSRVVADLQRILTGKEG